MAEWMKRFGLPPPDGRPLYQYRLTNDGFEELEAHLKAQAHYWGFSSNHDEALFVLWAAEWFRRCYRGGIRRWSDVGNRFGLRLPQGEWRDLAERGLRAWGLKPVRLNGISHRLLALARQGGFPIAALEEDGGWAQKYLEQLVGVLLAENDPSLEDAFSHASALGEMAPGTWRHDGLFAISADLSLAIVMLRRKAEEGGAVAGIPPSIWLETHDPDWRTSLPLVVDGAAGRRLVDGLIKAVVVKGGSGAIRAVRRLEREGGEWIPKLKFELNGRLKGADLAALDDTWSKLHMFAHGALGRFVSGELATVESGEAGEWVAIARSASGGPAAVPLNVAAQVELRGDGQRVGPPILLAGGAALTGELLVCQSESAESGDEKALTIVGTASGKYRANPLFLIAPFDWGVRPGGDEEAVEPVQDMADGRRLWRVAEGAIVENLLGDTYRMLAGQRGDERDEIVLVDVGAAIHGVELDGVDAQLFCGQPRIEVRERARKRAPQKGEAWWRKLGDREWQPIEAARPTGWCEFAWRDRGTGHLRDRKPAVIMPKDLRIDLDRLRDHVDLRVIGWDGGVEMESGTSLGDGRWRFGTQGAGVAKAKARLTSLAAPTIHLCIALPRQAWIYDWNQGGVAKGGRLSLAESHRFVARSDGRCELMADLLDRDGRLIPQAEIRWTFEDELPMSAIRDDLAALLRPIGDLDASVRLNFNDAKEDFWFISEFDLSLELDSRGLVASRAVVDETARIVGRSLHHACVEQEFGPYGIQEQLNHQPIRLPPLKGTWLIYLRSGERVLSRPYYLQGSPLDHAPSGLIAPAMAIVDRAKRLEALGSICAEAELTGVRSHKILRELIDLASSLNGLPPSTFDVLRMIGERPALAARLLFEAAPAELPELMALSDGLPFAWSLVPMRLWEAAAHMRGQSLLDAMGDVCPEHLALVARVIGDQRAAIAAIEPNLGLALGQSVETRPIRDAAQSFMQQSYHRAAGFARSPFRPAFASHLPQWSFSGTCWRALDAPCVAALAAAEKIKLDDSHLRCIKDVARRHPRYFQEAFASALKEN